MKLSNPLGRWAPSRRRPAATSVFADTQHAQEIWERRRRSATRYGLWGAAFGVIAGAVVYAPAAWLAAGVSQAAGQRVLLADARGTVWNGSAAVVLTGGPGSRDASSLPGRLEWSVRPRGLSLELRATHSCCLFGTTVLRWRPGLGRQTIELPAATGGIGQWPAAWLTGLGTPWNTLQPSGAIRLSSPGVTLHLMQGRWRLDGQINLDLAGIASRVSTLDELGSYRVVVSGRPDGAENATLQLSTLSGALQLSGQGQWVGPALRFQGEATAAPGAEPALNNLLNIIGRRQGARSVISIG